MNRNESATKHFRVINTEAYFQMVKHELCETGEATIRVTGDSMRPLLHHLRDQVVLVPPEKVRRGDIVLFDRRNGRYALHRVIHAGKRGFDMAGDNQWHMERDLPYEQIVGVVERICRNGRWVSSKNILMKIYSWGVTLLTVPRIYLRQAIRVLVKPFRRDKTLRQKGTL